MNLNTIDMWPILWVRHLNAIAARKRREEAAARRYVEILLDAIDKVRGMEKTKPFASGGLVFGPNNNDETTNP